MNPSGAHYPVIVATPNDAKKYSEACQRFEKNNDDIKKKKAFKKIRKIFGKIVKKPHNDKISVDDQYCFSIMEDEANETNYYCIESSTDDYSDYTTNYSKIIPTTPDMVNSTFQNNEVVLTNSINSLNKKGSKFSFIKKLKEKKSSKKSLKGYKDTVQTKTTPLILNEPSILSSVKLKEATMYDNSNIFMSPYLRNKKVTPSIKSSQEIISTPFSPPLPPLPNTPYMYNYAKNGKTGNCFINSRDDLSLTVSTRKDYASSIYSDESCHLPDDEENVVEDEIIPPSSSEATYNVKEVKPEEEKKLKKYCSNGHFNEEADKSNDTMSNSLQVPLYRKKKEWENPFGRISFIEYTIEKQKEGEKKENKNNTNKYVVTKPPLKTKNSKSNISINVNKRSVSSLTGVL